MKKMYALLPFTLFLSTCTTIIHGSKQQMVITSFPQFEGKIDFKRIDSVSKTIKYQNDIYKLTKDLTQPYDKQIEKVRSVFIWITDNISYDYKFFNKGKEIKMPECKDGVDCERLYREWEISYLKKVLKNKKGICDGYVRLFKKMCDIAGIRTEIISGYTKTKYYQIGSAGSVNHSWNAVWLDSTWHLLDPTWAAGYCHEDEETSKLLSYQKAYNNYYWFTSFHDLVRDHYPEEARWVLEPGYTKEKFANNPYYAPDIIPDIHLYFPVSGIITAQKGDTVHFKFDYRKNIRFLQINSNVFRNPAIWTVEKVKRKKVIKENAYALKNQQYIPFTRTDDGYEFDYIVTDSSLYYLDILFDYRRTMRFKVIIDD